MTRFARAKGSKASNEKAPADSTPWEVMKEQLLQAKKENENSKNRQAAEQQRIENYENFLKDRRVQKRPATWCDFPEAEQNVKNINKDRQAVKKKNKGTLINTGIIEPVSEGNVLISDSTEVAKKKKKKNKQSIETEPNKVKETANKTLKKKKSKQSDDIVHSTDTTGQLDADDSSQTERRSPKKKKNKKKQATQAAGDSNLNNDATNASNDSVPAAKDSNFVKQKNKKKNKNQSNSKQADNDNSQSDQQFDSQNNKNMGNKQNKEKAKKKKKLVDGQPVRRKEINDKSFQLVFGGKEVDLIRYDGFPIMRKDAERLAELKDSMIKKGIPKSEVQRTMKLERRRAEKALARLKRDVCYNCRKGGHNLSDCPELKSKIPGADGVCFKCGSTEHRQFECKVQRDKEFRFATCFICKEPGHIARQCPDNPKGLYPNGGACKLCGDVTHLRKDCPTASNKKEETSLKLQTLDSTDDIEGIGIQNKFTVPDDSTKKPKKIRF